MTSSAPNNRNDSGGGGSSNAQTQLVEKILAAETLYEVLDVDPSNLDPSSLRKAYLNTSVKVHPDKNPHPDATAAFQRVAEAWNTLSDDSARAAYDAELRNPGGFSASSGPSSSAQGGTQYAYDFERTHMPSFQEALFMFAAATSMFAGAKGGGGGGTGSSALHAASDFMETIFWAQKLAEGRQNQTSDNDKSGSNSDGNADAAESVGQTATNNPMASGFALGSGLRAVAATQRMMGFRNGAAATEKAANTVQMAAVGASVLKAANEVPAVKRTIERGKNTFQNNPQIGRGLKASLEFAGTLAQTLQEAHKEAQQRQKQANNNPGNN